MHGIVNIEPGIDSAPPIDYSMAMLRLSNSPRLGDIIERYIEEVVPFGKSTGSRHSPASRLRWWSERIGSLHPNEVTTATVFELRLQLFKSGLAASTCNRYVYILSAVFTIASNGWGLCLDNPCTKLKRLREPSGRIPMLSQDGRARLLQACKESNTHYLYPAVVLTLYMGLRHEELTSLSWQDIDLKERVLRIPDSKSGQGRMVPIPEFPAMLLSALQMLTPNCTVFPHSMREAWENARERAGIGPFHWHDMRHIAASSMSRAGLSDRAIAQVLGIKTPQVVWRYTHVDLADNQADMDTMGRHLQGLDLGEETE